MFEIGFSELVLIGIVALLVIGPERLPGVARTAGLWLGRLRGYVNSVKHDIDRELRTEELERLLREQSRVPALEEIIEISKDAVTKPPVTTPTPNPNLDERETKAGS